jgi:hypothetical protein
MMNNKTTLSAMVLTVGMVFTASSQAAEVSVEQFVSSMVSYTVSTTSLEIQNSIQGAVLSAANMFSLEEGSAVASHVTITDLDSAEQAEVANKAE